MSAIGPGDFVECISRDGKGALPHYTKGGSGVHVGGVYHVRAIFEGRYPDGSRAAGLKFHGLRGFNKSGVEGGWPVTMFRPIYRPKSSLIEGLLKPADAPADLQGVDA